MTPWPQLGSDTVSLTLAGNSGTGNSIQRLYPLTDGIGSIVAVTDPSGNVLERYAYDVNGLPEALRSQLYALQRGGLPDLCPAIRQQIGLELVLSGPAVGANTTGHEFPSVRERSGGVCT